MCVATCIHVRNFLSLWHTYICIDRCSFKSAFQTAQPVRGFQSGHQCSNIGLKLVFSRPVMYRFLSLKDEWEIGEISILCHCLPYFSIWFHLVILDVCISDVYLHPRKCGRMIGNRPKYCWEGCLNHYSKQGFDTKFEAVSSKNWSKGFLHEGSTFDLWIKKAWFPATCPNKTTSLFPSAHPPRCPILISS